MFFSNYAMKKEQKIFTFILIVYLTALFISTHIPVPDWARQMEMSDKIMHFAGYMVLSLLFWLSISYEAKALWTRFRPWLLSVILILYGIVDEISQPFMNRSTDIGDFAANLVGIASGMLLVSFLPACHIIMAIITLCSLFAPSIVKSNLIPEGSIYEFACYAAGFAIITSAWIIYLSSIFYLNMRKIKSLPIFFSPPAITVLIIKFCAQAADKPFGKTAILGSFVSIILTILIWKILGRGKAAI